MLEAVVFFGAPQENKRLRGELVAVRLYPQQNVRLVASRKEANDLRAEIR
jgi:hypothetical protein